MYNPAELERLTRELAETRAKLVATEHELAQVRQELAESEKAVHYLTQRDYAITREDIAEIEEYGVPASEVIKELEEMNKGTSNA